MTPRTPEQPSHDPPRHGEGCACVRCTGFAAGNAWRVGERNDLAVRHGGYSAAALSKRASELEPGLLADFQGHVDQALVAIVAEAQAQVEVGFAALTAVGSEPDKRLKYARLSEDAAMWVRTFLKVLDRVGATPAARAEVAARLARAGIDLRLSPGERDELRRLEAMTDGGDLLTLGDIRLRVRLRNLREKARGD